VGGVGGAGLLAVRSGRGGAGRDAWSAPPVAWMAGRWLAWEPLTSSAARAAADEKLVLSPLSPGGAESCLLIPGRDRSLDEDEVAPVARGELILPIPPRPVPALNRAGAPVESEYGERVMVDELELTNVGVEDVEEVERAEEFDIPMSSISRF
jgi:hypothetical protein